MQLLFSLKGTPKSLKQTYRPLAPRYDSGRNADEKQIKENYFTDAPKIVGERPLPFQTSLFQSKLLNPLIVWQVARYTDVRVDLLQKYVNLDSVYEFFLFLQPFFFHPYRCFSPSCRPPFSVGNINGDEIKGLFISRSLVIFFLLFFLLTHQNFD